MGYLKESIETLRALRLAIGDREVSNDPLVDELARMPACYVQQCKQMLDRLKEQFRSAGYTFNDEQISLAFGAIAKVGREHFVPAQIMELAYLPRPLAIGHGQTISHPHVVALMTAAVAQPFMRAALDVGTGSGYQAAILSHLCAQVTSVEIVGDLSRNAAARLRALDYSNIECIAGDVCEDGIIPDGSFDAIIIAAGSSSVPETLVKKLSVGGRLVMPVGETKGKEQLMLLEKVSADKVKRSTLGPARFVPLTGLGARSSGTVTEEALDE